MKVGFGAYAVGVLFMDSLLSIISIILWNFLTASFLLCHCEWRQCQSENHLPVPSPPLKPCDQLIYKGKDLDWNRQWSADWMLGAVWSIIRSIVSLISPLKPPQSSETFEKKMGNVPQLCRDTKCCTASFFEGLLQIGMLHAVTDDVKPLLCHCTVSTQNMQTWMEEFTKIAVEQTFPHIVAIYSICQALPSIWVCHFCTVWSSYHQRPTWDNSHVLGCVVFSLQKRQLAQLCLWFCPISTGWHV